MDIRTASSPKLGDQRKLLYEKKQAGKEPLLNERGREKHRQFIKEAVAIIPLLEEAVTKYKGLQPLLQLLRRSQTFCGTLTKIELEVDWLRRMCHGSEMAAKHGRINFVETQWTITKDLISEPNEKSAVGTVGPRTARLSHHEIINAVTMEKKHAFRMKDDDGNLYYEGVMILGDEADAEFLPLDDFGTPNAGCTSIEILQDDGSWQVV